MTWTLAAISGLDIWQILGDFKKWLKKWDCQRNPVNEVMPDNATRSKIMKEKNAKDETVSKC